MADISANTGTENEITMNKDMRYYQLHREEKLNKYHNNPEVIRKREEKLKKKAEKEAEREAKREEEKEQKRLEKEKKRQEKLALAIATSQKKTPAEKKS